MQMRPTVRKATNIAEITATVVRESFCVCLNSVVKALMFCKEHVPPASV